MEVWFEYVVWVYLYYIDYGGIVWYGVYFFWMEEVRVESLCFIGIEFVELVNFGCDLLVVDFLIKYY